MIITRPLRRLDLRSLALDAPLPFLPTCAGLGLPWPRRQESLDSAPPSERPQDVVPAEPINLTAASAPQPA